MTKCLKCGGTELAKGKITRPSSAILMPVVFEPDGLRVLTFTLNHGTALQPDSYACLACGTVWSQTDQNDLREFIRKHCKNPSQQDITP